MRCSKCAAENPDGAKFCVECASPFARRCSSCGKENPPRAKFCLECSKPIDSRPAATRETLESPVRVSTVADGAQLDGERKTVTALFADIKGSTELEQDLDPEEARAIVDPALKLMIEAVRRYDGYIVQSTGDGIFALFGAPVAHEDHPQRALYAALRMQEELRRFGSKLQAEGRAPIEIRVGVNTGEVVVRSIATGATQVEYTPIGHTTNLASRLQSIARTGSIAASEATRRFCEGYFTLKPLGPTRVKGVSESVNVYEVTGLGPLRTRLQRSAGRGLSKFVGRQAEMDSLKRAAEQAKAGHGQIVAAMAEAGVGKSRLLFEFKTISQSGWMVLEAFSVSHGKASAFLPVIDLLWGYFKITSNDDERMRREKINGKVVTLDRSLEDVLPYVHWLLGLGDENSSLAEMEPQTLKRRSLDAIKGLLLRESLNQPLMVIFEDLHWIDQETQAFLNLLADSIGTAKILLLINYRPEYTHQWNSKTYYTQLRLDPLGKENADEMLTALVGDGPDLQALKRTIIERTEGNPFFMEETVQVLLDEGALVRNGTVKLTKSLNELRIPPTVQAILSARIDRLPPAEKELLQTLAVIGKEFQVSLVRAVAGTSTDELARMLDDLQLGEFIYEQPAVGDIEYTFKHALTLEVAYNSMLIERRKLLHERIGEAIESLYPELLDDHFGELAHHFGRSDKVRKAVEYLWHSAQQAAHRSAYSEAVASVTRALEILQKLPDDSQRARDELRLQIILMECWVALAHPASPKARQAMERGLQLSEQLGDSGEIFAMLTALCVSYEVGVQFHEALDFAERVLAIAEAEGNAAKMASARALMASELIFQGEFEAAREHLDKALTIPDSDWRSGGPSRTFSLPRSHALNFLALGLWFLGYPDQASRYLERAIALNREISNTADRVAGLMFNLWLDVCSRDRLTLGHARSFQSFATENGRPGFAWLATFFAGWALAEQGHTAEAVDEIERSMSGQSLLSEDLAPPPMASWFYFLLADIYGKAGQTDGALNLVAQALSERDKTGEGRYEAELHRLKGELLLANDTPDLTAAEQSFLTAIEISRKQHAKSWELRSTTSLARLLAKQGKRDEARAMLADIYNWFTEGFDTADLKDAKAMLDELSGGAT
jgi:class 3 adenylate cyclase/predicted ATPase